MIQAQLYFGINLPWQQTSYEQLRNIGLPIKNEDGTYHWKFHISNLKKVIELIGKPITLKPEIIKELQQYAPPTAETFNGEKYKGKGYFQIIHKSPKLYIIETVIRKKVIKKTIPIENIILAWNMIKKYPLHKEVKGTTIQKNICWELGLTRFFRRDTNTFDHHKFFGNRTDYFTYFYYPIKILECLNAIKHKKTGQIIRTAKEIKIQTKIDQPTT